METLNEKISMGRERRVTVQVNLLPSVINTIDRIRHETGVPKARIVEHFVSAGMDATGYGPKGHRFTEQSADSNTNTKTDIEAFCRGLSPEKLRELADLLKDMADSR